MFSHAASPQETAPSASDLIRKLIYGYRDSRAIHVAARFGIADVLKGGARHYEALAQAVGAHPKTLRRLLRALVAAGVVRETEPGYFTLTPVGAFLQTDAPGSYRAVAIMQDEEWLYRSWGGLYDSVKTGETALEKLLGVSQWGYFAAHPEASRIFNDAMREHTLRDAGAIAAAYEFSGARTVVDVGGGKGMLLAAILKTDPDIQAILFDLPSVINEARDFLRAQGVAGRCELVGGSFLESVPSGGDLYLLKWVLNDWSDDSAIMILRNCHRAMRKGAKLLTIETLFVPGSETFDLHMLVLNGGAIRTEDELKELLVSAGFAFTRVVPTRSQLSIIECERA